jgi:hypothetical protein
MLVGICLIGKLFNLKDPFEVVARSGDKTVSGRGKIAVLK